MKSQIRVSTAHMGQDTNNLQEQMGRIRQEVTGLQEAMGRLASCWEGTAWEAFQIQVNDSITYMLAVNEWVQAYLAATNEASVKYRACEEQVYSRIRMLRV